MNRREIDIKRVEFSVPLTPGFGAAHTELVEAIRLAAGEYCQLTGTPPEVKLPDDAIRIDQGDGEVVVLVEVRRQP